MNKKKIIILLMGIAALFLLSGCSIPTDPDTGKYIQITTDTTFQSMLDGEGFFSALLVYPIAKAVNYLTPLFPESVGVAVAVAVVTAFVNTLVILFTFKSNIAQQKMTELQPEMNRITKKYEGKTDDASKNRQAQEINALYKKHGVNPFATILSLFIQFPILIAMYQAVQRSQAVATGSFLGMSLEISPLDGVTSGQFGYIALFAMMVGCQFLSMKMPTILANRKAKEEAEKAHKKYVPTKQAGGSTVYTMLIVIAVMAIAWPAAMSIYWIISSLVIVIKTIVLNIITNKHKEAQS
ncbi:MAG: membrane protein insertase YidC [Erysipelotrichaceae bacterium]